METPKHIKEVIADWQKSIYGPGQYLPIKTNRTIILTQSNIKQNDRKISSNRRRVAQQREYVG